MIMPMFYTADEGMLFREAQSEEIPSSWDEMLESPADDIRAAYGFHMWAGRFRQNCFGQIADNFDEELLLDKEELFQRTKEALDLYANTSWRETNICSLDGWNNSLGVLGGNEYTYFPFYNTEGGLTVAVDTWCAVNANTKYPEEAFFIIDMLLSKEFQCQEAFWMKETPSPALEMSMTFFWTAGTEQLPVHTEPVANYSYKYMTYCDGQRKLLKGIREDISSVYITSNLDREVENMFHELITQIDSGSIPADGEIRKATDQCHMTLRMMLAES